MGADSYSYDFCNYNKAKEIFKFVCNHTQKHSHTSGSFMRSTRGEDGVGRSFINSSLLHVKCFMLFRNEGSVSSFLMSESLLRAASNASLSRAMFT